METKIGLQLYSVRSAMEKDFIGTLEKVKEAGYNCVEFAGYGGFSAKDLKKELDRIGLIPYSSHVGMDQLANKLDEVVEFSKELGLSYVILPWSDTSTKEKCKAVNDVLVKAQKALAPYGIKVGYHNHSHEFEKIDGKYAFDLLLENDENVEILAEVDTCWAQYADVDPVQYIKSLGKKAGPVHFKDINSNYKELKGHDINVEVGNGIVDFPAIIKVVKDAGTYDRGFIVEQEAFTRDMFESIKISCDNIKKMIG